MYSLKWAQYVYLKRNKSEQQTNLDSNKKSLRFNETPKRQMYKMYRRHIAKSIGSPLLMKGLTTLVIYMSTNLNV